ncbi:MAG: hypothetical protein K6F29_09580 [Bacteroidales bacterium]|nr:hypothetical protein [Bacteroidales bacterium]
MRQIKNIFFVLFLTINFTCIFAQPIQDVITYKDSLYKLAEKDRITPNKWELIINKFNEDSIWTCYYPNGKIKKRITYHPNVNPYTELKYSNGQLKAKGYVFYDDTSYLWSPSFLYSSEVNFIYDYDGDYDWVFYKYLDSKNKTYYVDGDYVYGSLFTICVRSDSVHYNDPICEFRVEEIKSGWKITVFLFDSKERKRNEHSDRDFLKSFYSKVYPQVRLKYHTTHHFYIYKGLIRCQNIYIIKYPKFNK